MHGQAEHHGRRFEVIDTGGIVVDDQEYIPSQILRQAQLVLEGAAQIIFLVDGRAEITGADRDLARMLQRLGQPVTLAVNKADTAAQRIWRTSFTSSASPTSTRFPPNTAPAWTRCSIT